MFFIKLLINTAVLFTTETLLSFFLIWCGPEFISWLNSLFILFMDRIPLSIGSGVGPSNLPDLNSPAAEEDPGDRHDQKGKSVETAIYELELAKIQEQKDRLADRIRPLIEEEAQRCRRQYGHRQQGALPSPNAMVENIINRFASKGAQVANAPNAPLQDLRYLKKWLTLAEKSAENDGDGGMSIR